MPTPTPQTASRRRARVALLAAMLLGGAAAAGAEVRVLINPGDQGEQSRYAVFSAWKSAVEQALRREKLAPVVVQLSTDATADLGLTRSRIPDIFIAPSHVIGSAVRYGYTPVLGFDRPVQAVLVVPKDSAVTNLAQAQGKRLGLPLQDSVVTYLLRGEVNAANTTLKRHFGALYETRYQDALLPCLQLKRCEAVVVERTVFDRWVAAGQPLKIVMETRSAPSLSMAIKDGVKPGAEALRAAMIESLGTVPGADGAKFVALAKTDFDYVSKLGYFTPRTLPGATLVEAKDVTQLLQAGGTYIDTRTEAEFKAGHVPGAKLVPYVEKSAKDADFKAEDDQFDLSKLPPDRASTLVFACNGAECWKSFKASHAASKAGYTKVHWFRGGFPEWRGAGLKVETAP
jgi:rhodanese-related sulfurtransferase